LEERGFAVATEAATAADVSRAVAELHPDVLLVHEDVALEGGESIVPAARAASPKTRIIVLTSDRASADPALVAAADAVVEEGPGLKELEGALAGRRTARAAVGPIAFAAAAAARPRPGLRERGWVERLQGAAAASIIVLAVVLARGMGPGAPTNELSGTARVHLVAAQQALEDLADQLPTLTAPQAAELAAVLLGERAAANAAGADVTALDVQIAETLGPILETLPDEVASAVTSILGDLVTGGPPPSPTPALTPSPSPQSQPEPTKTPEPSPSPAATTESIPETSPSPTEESPSPTEESPSPTETESPSPTETESPSPTETESPSPTDTESPSPTETESPSPTDSESPSPTETESPSPTETESPSPTDTESPSPTDTESPSPTDTESPCPDGGFSASHHCEPCPDGYAPDHHCDDANDLVSADEDTTAGTIYVVPPGIVVLLATSGLARRRLRRRRPGR
jgi:hypothetical protein